MQGLGEIIRANLQVIGADINRAGKLRRPGKYGVVSRNGDPRDGGPGVPWRVRHAKESNNFLGIKAPSGKWHALYWNSQGVLVAATDALSRPIECDSEWLAKSVARYRRRRLRRFR